MTGHNRKIEPKEAAKMAKGKATSQQRRPQLHRIESMVAHHIVCTTEQLVAKETLTLVGYSLYDIQQYAYVKARAEVHYIVHNVVEQGIFSLSHWKVMDEVFDKHMAD